MFGSGRTVLIVEDDDSVRHMYRTALTLAGFATREARNGFEALQIIDGDPPDVVVLDLGLPLISGVVVHQDIAARTATKHIPVIIVTGSAENLEWMKVECVIRKPASPDQLIETVRKCLGAPNES